jgi:hypothetical protein
MKRTRLTALFALSVSVLVHGGLMLFGAFPSVQPLVPEPLPAVTVRLLPPEPSPPPPLSPSLRRSAQYRSVQYKQRPSTTVAPTPVVSPPVPASLAAPQPPSAEEWQRAATYTLKNSKRYRHAWGKQVRSMMGTAVEGPDQGLVRFRITLNPDGSIAHIEELWSTSSKASELAWKAIRALPPLPPTPGKTPLVFEQTIALMPYETGWPPSYKYDCLPDPPVFKNRFAWNGASPQQPAPPESEREERSPDCHPSDVEATFEEEDAELQRQIERNRYGR